ncbi:MAG: putative Mg2+ transporter-C (MgtC) family protein [Humisphaera sp.]|nr:putative Mg2+ transporter-C (MgtC) family protein [Humisphaera sp.]
MQMAAFDPIDNIIRDWGAHFNWPAEYAVRLLMAMFAGGLVGLERELRGRQAGFRTNILVCVGSCLTMIVSISFASRAWPHEANVNMNIDPARIAYGVMTGIGFLGAGTIIKSGGAVRGLTTAAAMWCVAAVGLAAGFGMYTLTAIATLLIVTALWVLDYFEGMVPKWRYRTVVVRRKWKPGVIPETIERFKKAHLRVIDASMERTYEDLAHTTINVRVAFVRAQKYYDLERQLEADPDYDILATKEE